MADAAAVAASPFKPVADGVLVTLRVAPKARGDRVDGLATEADGGVALKVAVTAAPEGGQANAAVIRLLAKAWHVPKSSLSVAAGAAARRKTLHLQGEPAPLLERLETWRRSLDG